MFPNYAAKLLVLSFLACDFWYCYNFRLRDATFWLVKDPPSKVFFHTYIHSWPLQPFSQDYWPSFSHHLRCVCQFFIHKWRDLQLKVDSERQVFWETFHCNFTYSQSFARNLLRRNRRRNIFRISFWCLAWDSNPGFSSNKPTHYLLDHGDFKIRSFTKVFSMALRV